MADTREKLIELLRDSPMLNVLYQTDTEWEWAADYLIANGVTVQEWISVKDRLPKPHTYVICCGEIGGATLGYRMPNREWKGVTHWMPLPEPPKGE